jgi:hypothetical protein
MGQEPEEEASQHHSLARMSDTQVPPPIAKPVPKVIAPVIVEGSNEAYDPKLRRRYRLALILAVLIDCIQIGFFPLFAPGLLSIADALLDCVAFLLFWRLIGWHWALVPACLFELLPFVDVAPTWTLAVCIAIRGQKKAQGPVVTRS